MDEPASRFGQDLRGLGRGSCAGYYALTPGSVHKQESPERIAKGLANQLTRVEEAADIVGVRAVMVHAIDEAARGFYEHFEFEPSPVDPFQLLLLLKDLRKARR
jgi:hypothetical protein